MYPQYRMFCIDEGVPPVKKTNFIKRLKHHGFHVKRTTKAWIAYTTIVSDKDIEDVDF